MSFISGAASAKIAVAIVVSGVLALGSVGAAAYSAALPTELQQAAHELIGAPATDETTDETPTDDASATPSDDSSIAPSPAPSASAEADDDSVGPDASGRSAYGLCNAYAHGGLNETSMAFAALEVAAGISAAEEAAIALIETGGEAIDEEAGEPAQLSGIEAYCATVPSPGKSGEHASDKAKKVTADRLAKADKAKADKAKKAEKAKADKAKKAKADKAKANKASSANAGSKAHNSTQKPGKGKGAGKSGGR